MIMGYWGLVYNYMFNRDGSSSIWVNVLLIAVAVGAIIAVIKGGVSSD